MLTPLGDQILVERMEAENKTSSGLFIPDTAKEQPQQGKVISVGPGSRNDKGERVPLEIKAGKRILFTKFGGTEVTLDGKDYMILNEDDVLALVT